MKLDFIKKFMNPYILMSVNYGYYNNYGLGKHSFPKYKIMYSRYFASLFFEKEDIYVFKATNSCCV